MYIPDLFGAYVKGRELAIAKNWEDLANYEKIEDARNDNDLKAMDIWERRQQMPGKMNMFYNNVDISQMNTDVAREAHPGLIANARTGSLYAQDNHAIFLENRDYGRNVANRLYRANLEMLDAAGQNKAGQANYWLTDNRAYQHGGNVAQQAYDTGRGNSITAAHYPTVAQQKNREGDAAHGLNMANYNYQTDYMRGRHEQLPDELKLQGLHTKNGIYTAEGFIPNQIAHLQDYMYGMGYTPDTTPATGQAQSSVPVGTNSVLAPTSTPQTSSPRQNMVQQMLSRPKVFNYPVSPEHGAYRPLLPAPSQDGPYVVPPNNDPNSVMNLANSVGVSYLPAYRVVP